MAYILTKHDLAYFPVPKIACTSLKSYFYEIEHGVPFASYSDDAGRVIYIHDKIISTSFFIEAQVERLAACRRIAVIRDPIERFISAYANRVVSFKELSATALDTPRGRELALTPTPSFAHFVERLEDYRLASPSIRHHTDPATVFLGPDLGYFHKIYKISEIGQLHADVCAITGTHYAMPHEQKAGVGFTPPGPAHECWHKLRDFYAGDYALMQGYYSV